MVGKRNEMVHYVDVETLSFGLTPRSGAVDMDHVNVLAELLPHLPPIVVHGPTRHVVDGVHRVHAALSVGKTQVAAVLFTGSQIEAFLHAVEANTAHGKPLSLAEREAAAVRIIQDLPLWSDRRVATTCGLSAATIGKLRRSATDHSDQLRTRVGRDGKARPVDAAAVRRQVADALRADPEASMRSIAARVGASEGTVRDVRARLDRGADILPPRLARRDGDDGESNVSAWDSDEALRSNDACKDFGVWLDAHLLTDDSSWNAYVDVLPISRVYEVADSARTCSEVWRRFALALEQRAQRRRSAGDELRSA